MAADRNKLTVEVRESFGKGAARKLRAVGKIPAVLYGHGTKPQHLSLPGHETMLLVRRSNALIELHINGKQQLALVKDVQRDPVRQVIEHIDLTVIRKGEKVTVDVPVHLEGESAPGTMVALEANSLSVEVEAISIPENFVVVVEDLEEGTQIFAKDVELPEGAELLTDPEALVVSVRIPIIELDPELDAEDAGAEGDEGDAAEGDDSGDKDSDGDKE